MVVVALVLNPASKLDVTQGLPPWTSLNLEHTRLEHTRRTRKGDIFASSSPAMRDAALNLMQHARTTTLLEVPCA